MSEKSKSKELIIGIIAAVVIVGFVVLLVLAISANMGINKSVSTTEQFLELAGEKYISWSASGYSSSKLGKVNLKSDLDFKGQTIEVENCTYIDASKDFNGNGHTIKNLNVNFTCTTDNLSVSFIEAANVTDLNFENCSFTYLGQKRFFVVNASENVRNVKFISGELKAPYAKTLAPISSDIVEECENRMRVEGGNYTAGIASNSCVVQNCVNYGEIIGKKYVGGVGTIIDSGGASSHDDPIISNCVNKGSVKGTENVGGILGASFSTVKPGGDYVDFIASSSNSNYSTRYTKKIDNCKNEGDVSGNDRVGGIVGYSLRVVVSCENTGSVTATGNEVGGIAGKLSLNYDVAYSNNKNSGKISGNEYVGGIYGYAVHSDGGLSDSSKITNTITRNVNTGEVLGNEYVGGIIGYYMSEYRYVKLNITYCENIGEITSQTYAAGIVGYAVLGKNEFSCDSTNQNNGSINGTSYEDLYNTGSK